MGKRMRVIHLGGNRYLVLDRMRGAWTLLDGRCLVDYGDMHADRDYLAYLPGRLLDDGNDRALACAYASKEDDT